MFSDAAAPGSFPWIIGENFTYSNILVSKLYKFLKTKSFILIIYSLMNFIYVLNFVLFSIQVNIERNIFVK